MRRSLISVLLGLLFAAGAIYFVYITATPEQQAVAPVSTPPPTVEVLVAASEIPFGTRIQSLLIKTIEWPEGSAPEGVVTDKNELLEGPEGARIALRSFTAGEPFFKSKLSGFGEKPTLSRRVADEKRALSIRVDDVSGVAGFLLPGDRVDVLLTRQIGNDRENLVTDVILQNVSVLGIDQLANQETESPVVARTATVEVTPEEAQKLTLAQQIGTLSLTLRNYTDSEAAKVSRVSVNDLGVSTARPAPRRDNRAVVRIRKGTKVTSERVDQ